MEKMKTLFKMAKMFFAVVFGLFAFLFIAIWLTEPKKTKTEYVQQGASTETAIDQPNTETMRPQQTEPKVKKDAIESEDPETFMRRAANKGDTQLSLGVGHLYVDIHSCPRTDCEIIETVQLPNYIDVTLGTTTSEETEQGRNNWVKATYYGEVCKKNIDRKTGLCSKGYLPDNEITGWVNFATLDKERPQTFKQKRELYSVYEKFISYKIFERNCNPSGTIVSNNIERQNEYHLKKYYNKQIKSEIEENILKEINAKYSDIEAYCAAELPKYLNAQQILLQNRHK